METLNVIDYLSVQRVDTHAALWLGRALLAARPTDAGDGVREMSEALEAALEALATAYKRQQAQQNDDLRQMHRAVCAQWGALVGRIEHCRVLPAEGFPHGAAVERLLAILAHDGHVALGLAYPNVWTTLHTRLSLVADASLWPVMMEVAGAPFVLAAELSLEGFGRALGITAATTTSDDTLRELVWELMHAVGDYTLQVLATVRRHRPETGRVARAALRPLDELRSVARRRHAEREAGEGDPDVDDRSSAKTRPPEKVTLPAAPPSVTLAPRASLPPATRPHTISPN